MIYKKIIITQRTDKIAPNDEIRDNLDTLWTTFFNRLNNDKQTILLYPLPNFVDNLNAWVDGISPDGILLSGGNTISDEVAVQRKNIELQLLDYAANKNIPVLGVCRGMQMLAYWQKIPLVETQQNHIAVRHNISFSPIFSYPQKFTENVNSYHKFMIQQNAQNLQNFDIIATSENDNCIEMIKHKNKNIFGIMWHPEREENLKNFDKILVENVFNLVF